MKLADYRNCIDDVLFSGSASLNQLKEIQQKAQADPGLDLEDVAITTELIEEAIYYITGIWKGRCIKEDDDVFTLPWRMKAGNQWADYAGELVKIVGFTRIGNTLQIEHYNGKLEDKIKPSALKQPTTETKTQWKEHKDEARHIP